MVPRPSVASGRANALDARGRGRSSGSAACTADSGPRFAVVTPQRRLHGAGARTRVLTKPRGVSRRYVGRALQQRDAGAQLLRREFGGEHVQRGSQRRVKLRRLRDVDRADSRGRCNTSMRGVAMGRPAGWMTELTGRLGDEVAGRASHRPRGRAVVLGVRSRRASAARRRRTRSGFRQRLASVVS